jgi:DNA-binding MarR family transcriptional regulator
LLEVDRKTIGRALERLESAGLIERRSVTTRVNGSARRDSLVRIIPSQEAAL